MNEYYLSKEWATLREKVVLRDKETCYYCGLRGFQADHIVPRSHGGPDKMTNLVCCCDRCNGLLGSRFFFSLDEKKRFIKSTIAGKPYKPGRITPAKGIPHKFNDMTPKQYQDYLAARKSRVLAAIERDAG